MTKAADIELLPLPRTLQHADDADLATHVQDYARANVAHYIKQRDAVDPLAVLARAQRAEARAERLAEALRSALEEIVRRMPDQAGPAWIAKDIAQAALAVAKKEVSNG